MINIYRRYFLVKLSKRVLGRLPDCMLRGNKFNIARIVRKEHLILSTFREFKLNYKDQLFFKMLSGKDKELKKMSKISTLLTDNNLSTNNIICLV